MGVGWGLIFVTVCVIKLWLTGTQTSWLVVQHLLAWGHQSFVHQNPFESTESMVPAPPPPPSMRLLERFGGTRVLLSLSFALDESLEPVLVCRLSRVGVTGGQRDSGNIRAVSAIRGLACFSTRTCFSKVKRMRSVGWDAPPSLVRVCEFSDTWGGAIHDYSTAR